uniref:response regulator n=1 Tax=Marinobacterium profundum TaxID=1714300 RepID=UPI00082A9514|nr:response regulator [Marinobacterium profundum]
MDSEKTMDVLALAFLEKLPARIQAISAQAGRVGPGCWPAPAVQELCRLVHSLVGAASTFSQPGIGDKARCLLDFIEGWSAENTGPTETEWAVWTGLLEAMKNVPLASPQQRRWYDSAVVDAGTAQTRGAAGSPRPSIDVLEDDPEQAEVLCKLLESHGYDVSVYKATSGFRSAWLTGHRADLVLADMVFAERVQAGAEVVVEVLATVENPPPVVFLSARDDVSARLAAFRAGASRYLTKPVQPTRLFELVDELSLRRPAAPYRVMVVDDDCRQADLTARPLLDAGMSVQVLNKPLETLDVLRSFGPDLLLLNISMKQVSGPEIAAILREEDQFAFLPILFISAEKSEATQLMALGLGGDDFLLKPIRSVALLAAVRARAWRARRMRLLGTRYQALSHEYDSLLDGVTRSVPLALADATGSLTSVNDRLHGLLGYEDAESWRQEGMPVLSQQLQDLIVMCLAVGETWQGEMTLQHRNGQGIAVESTITPFLDAGGSSCKAFVFVQPM